MNNWPDRSSRVDQLIFTLNKLYCSKNNNETEETQYSSINIEEVLSLLKENTFLDANIKESHLFKGRLREELIVFADHLYSLYIQDSGSHCKITLAFLLARIFDFYLPGFNALISTGVIASSITQALNNGEYEIALKQLSSWIKDPSQTSESVMKAIGTAFLGRGLQLLDEKIQAQARKGKPEPFNSFSLQGYQLRMQEWFSQNHEVIRMPVRIDLTNVAGVHHFLLAPGISEKAISISIDLWDKFLCKHDAPLQVIVRPIHDRGIRLTSIDLACSKLITSLGDLFNLRNDDLSLLKAAVIASGIIPPAAIESPENSLENILQLFLKEFPEYHGFELITKAVEIPRGAGLAVSSNLLAGMLIALMRFSGQSELGQISEEIKREAVTRALYAQWLNGSISHFQDYGGLWGGFKEVNNGFSGIDSDKSTLQEFAPICQEIRLSREKASQILNSMVLVNGGMGQEAGSDQEMMLQQFITKNDIAMQVREKSKNRYSLIKQAVLEGSAQELSLLAYENFADRVLISPIFNNLYHEQVAESLSLLFGDDIWGYSSTGSHPGSEGIFWVDPDAKELFEKSFVDISSQVQKDLRGQIYFKSTPQVYNFKLNEEGVTYESMKLDSAQQLIELWKCQEKKQEIIAHYDQVELIKDIFGYNENLFLQLKEDYKHGNISVVKNLNHSHDQVNNKQTLLLPQPWSVDYIDLFQQGIEYLTDPLGYVILNGGENTRYGSHVIRGTNPFIYTEEKYCSPVELKMANLRFLRENFQAKVYPVFLNGHFTEKNTRRVLKSNNNFGIDERDVFHSAHEVIHRVIPSIEDLDHWFEKIRGKSCFARKEELAHQNHASMKMWIKERGAGEVYQASGWNKANTLVSPGDYFSFISIVNDGTLGKLLKRGVKRIVVSSNDNLLATVDPAILAHHMLQENKVTCEVIPKSTKQDFQISNHDTSCSNPITSWIEIDVLLNLLDLKEADLIAATEGNKLCRQRCHEAVRTLTVKLPVHPVLKHLNEDTGNGITYSYPVVQFEKQLNDLITLLNPKLLLVPKLMRHTQIKSAEDMHKIYTEQSLEVLQSQIELLNTKQQNLKERAVWV